ncbi:MAG: DNA cytosine methyltransferase [Bacteroidetes bacterium]|nr:DNA cytosine methyltransferase [Bacteroidota bacterium]
MNFPIAAVDIFCGVGGLTYGLNKSGIKVIAGYDIDEKCKYAYEKNNDSLFIQKNVQDITKEEILNLYPSESAKVLVGCAPCQPFSTHTHKEKDRQTREDWGLLYHFLNLIRETQPEVISMENVPGIIRQQVFADFTNGLIELEYKVSWQVVYGPDYGIPQRRRRLVLLASKFGEIKLIPPTTKPNRYKTVKMAIGNLEPIDAGVSSRKDRLHQSATLTKINLERVRKSKPGGSWRDWDEDLRAECHRKSSGKTYGSVYSRMEWDKPSPTITTQFFNFGTGRFGHPEQDRAISIREAALLQTFPKKYKFIAPRCFVEMKRLGKHIGNAVPPRLGEIIGKSIIKHFENYYE